MHPIVQPIETDHTPESLAGQLQGEPGIIVLRSALFDSCQARYSFVTARPFLTFSSFGSRCELIFTHHAPVAPKSDEGGSPITQFGNPWHFLDVLLSRYELLDQMDLPFPLGGCFGYWGYDLKNFVEPRLPRRAINDIELPDCHVGFYDSLVVFDHQLGKTWIVSTGLNADGSRNEIKANDRADFWRKKLQTDPHCPVHHSTTPSLRFPITPSLHHSITSNLSQSEFIRRAERIQRYIRAGHIYQANLSHRLAFNDVRPGWDLFQRLTAASPAPFSAYVDCDDFQIASSSPELFLRMSGSHVRTRPIKGTRPRSADPLRDAQLSYELQTSPKEMAELLMITDLLRNDLGKVCEFGSVQVPELARLERYPHVQHLVSTVEGLLRDRGMTHLSVLQSCFPGGSVTGAPKIRAMEIIDELEPVARGPYTGALGYLGFNRESQLSIIIRTAICQGQTAWFHVGAGIVADSNPPAEYEETLAKARGFLEALGTATPVRPPQHSTTPTFS
jgi:para-aminobenzoate synthetase component 1